MMDELSFRHSHKRLYFQFTYGFISIGLGLFFHSPALKYLWIFVGCISLIYAYLHNKLNYITITPTEIQLFEFTKKSIKLNEIKSVQKIHDEYIIQASKKHKININSLNKEDLPKFEKYFQELSLKSKQ